MLRRLTCVARLSDANTTFHGKKDVKGALKYLDRGDNVWE